eukprot:gene20140-24154_t
MKKGQPMHDTPRLADAMRAAAAEIYLYDAASLQLLDANDAACANLHYARAELQAMTVFSLAPQLEAPRLAAVLAGLDDAIGAQARLHLQQRRRDGSLRQGRALILAVAEDLRTPQATAAALAQVQSRFNAIVSNTPGLVYQFCLHADGRASFAYLSDGCQALLGLSPAQLHAHPELFYQLILADDRASYLDSMLASKAALWSWNWEGRIWVDAWKDVKWINLRSTPRALADGTVQWEGIMTNITESRLEQIEVRQSRARLAELTAHIDKVKEHERTRLARELHDDLGGNLTAIKMALAMLTRRLPPDDPLLQEKADYVDALVDRSIDAVHRISLDLRPSMLDLGLVAALDWQVKEFARQALTNIAKHARAGKVTVRLARQRQQLRLTIADDGVGMRLSDRAKPQSFGIRGMAERASALGGVLSLMDGPDGGTVLSIKIRLSTPREAIIAAAASAPAHSEPPQDPGWRE